MNTKDIPEKGAILQRDRETYAIAPHIAGGFTDTATLRKICDVADKYKLELKITSAQRIAMFGVREEELDAVWADLAESPGAVVGLCVRSIRICPGTQQCKRAVLDSASLGLKLDRIYYAKALPNKMKMGVSGCLISCSESGVKDIGIVGHNKGWRILVGGNAGPRPRLADLLVDNVQTEDEVLEIVAKVVELYSNNPQQGRLGKLVEEMGIEAFRGAVLGSRDAAAGK